MVRMDRAYIKRALDNFFSQSPMSVSTNRRAPYNFEMTELNEKACRNFKYYKGIYSTPPTCGCRPCYEKWVEVQGKRRAFKA